MYRPAFAALSALLLGACNATTAEVGREPLLTPVGAGLHAPVQPIPAASFAYGPPPLVGSLWNEGRGDLYRDRRVARIGDVLTVVIAINDRASFGNVSDRVRESKVKNTLGVFGDVFGYGGNGKIGLDVDSTSASKGTGVIDRSEKIQMSVAAVVTGVLPNGNLIINGSQEIRVNYELRNLQIAGIVQPRDISRDNTIAYDRIAEARVSYGGAGRSMEVQQPGMVHQFYDRVTPF